MRLLLLTLLLTLLVLPIPTQAHTPDETRLDAITVAVGLGQHSYILHGQRWVYTDTHFRITRTLTSGIDATVTDTVIVRYDGLAVGKWVDGAIVRYTPGTWENELYVIAQTVGSK